MVFPLTGCLKRDNLEDIDIYTTVYPFEYITERLYGEHSQVHSIYPRGVSIQNYQLTDKQIKDYSKSKLFIFSGLSPEKDYVAKFFENNKKLKIIDTTSSMEITHGYEEMWLDPSNFLMLSQNIKNGFKEYINNHYLKNEIEENYQKLKIEVSNIDAEISTMSESSNQKYIIVTKNVFKFLEKYGFNVISLEEGPTLTDKAIEDAKALLKNGGANYIFVMQNEEISDTVKKIQEETGAKTLTLNLLDNLSESDQNSNKNYLTIMNENLEALKQELYD